MVFRNLIVFLCFFEVALPVHADDTRSITSDIKRHFRVHLPPQYGADKQLPMVLVLHGGGGGPDGTADTTGMNDTADKYGFIVVYPAGTGKLRNKGLTWNAGNCCGEAVGKHIDDVKFISGVIDYMAQHYHIDTKRVYATGISNGAQMSYRLACELSNRIAAIAPVSGQIQVPSCDPAYPVSVLHIHGTADQCARYEGSASCGGCFSHFLSDLGFPAKNDGWACPSVPDTIRHVTTMDSCNPAPRPGLTQGHVQCMTYSGCRDNTEVTLCTIAGGGHSWPGGKQPAFCERRPDGKLCKEWVQQVGTVNYDISANEVMWAFFARHWLSH